MTDECTARRLSWLLIEQLHLGELDEDTRSRVEAHLTQCPSCLKKLKTVQEDTRPMPPLLLRSTAPRRRRLAVMVALATALLAILLVVLLAPDQGSLERTRIPAQSMIYKGGELAMVLVRERDGSTTENPTHFLPGDRFKVLMTCPGEGEILWHLVVFQGDEVHFPFPELAPAECGNQVALPGAFGLTGEQPAVVCLLVGDHLPDRQELMQTGISGLSGEAVCSVLNPAE